MRITIKTAIAAWVVKCCAVTAGFAIVVHRIVGTRPQNPYCVSRKPA